jgi:hypothetical protein
MILKLFGCKGYAYNVFVDKLGLSKHYIKLLHEHKPDGTGTIEELKFSKLNHIEKDTYYLCKVIYKSNPIVIFVIYNNTIFLSWGKTPCKTKHKWNLVNCKKSSKTCLNMNIKKRHVSNIMSKLKELTTQPSLKILYQLFGYDKSYIQPQNDVKDLLERFKNADIYAYTV